MNSSQIKRNSSISALMENDWLTCLMKEPEERVSEDSELIFANLKTLRVFERYPEEFLRDISVFVTYEEFPPHTTLFRPGDEGLFWYTVLSGALEMFHEDSGSNQVNSICCLSEGSSFGEGVLFGSKRETMIVTTEPCQLLCVEADQIRSIYETHQASFKSIVSLSSRPASISSVSSDVADGVLGNGGNDTLLDVYSIDDDQSLSVPVQATPETELALAGRTLYQLIMEHFPDLMIDQQVNMYTYKNCCSGKRLVDWVIGQSLVGRSRHQVVIMWQALLSDGFIEHVLDVKRSFVDDDQVYYRLLDQEISDTTPVLVRPSSPGGRSNDTRRMTNGSLIDSPIMSRSSTLQSVSSSTTESASPSHSPRSSVSSLLEECFDVISQLAPESLIFSTLLKKPAERTEEDICVIYDELLQVKAFAHLSNAIKEELATIVQFENHPIAGKFLYREGDEGTSWYIILRGSVNIVMNKKNIVCSLKEGDEFGKLALLNNAPRTSSIQLREPNCCFLKIEGVDYKRILMSAERKTIKLKEHGRDVLHFERSVGGRYRIAKGTPKKMLEYILTYQIDPGEIDEEFARHFFLTYPAFMPLQDLCTFMIEAYHDKSPPTNSHVCTIARNSRLSTTEELSSTEATEEQMLAKKRRIVHALIMWLDIAKGDLVKDNVFQQALKKLQDSLKEDKLEEENKNLTIKLMESIKQRQAAALGEGSKGLSAKLPFPLKKANTTDIRIELGICAVPPCQPIDPIHIRVHTLDKMCCRLHIKLETKAKEIHKEACEKLSLDPSDYVLCEGKSSGEIVYFKDEDLSIPTELSVNGRLYVIPKQTPKTISPLPDQLKKPTTPFLDSEPSREIACHLTVYDWNLFINIHQMEFIYLVFGRERFSKITSNLDMLIRRFNEIQFWVITEVCNESNLQKRVKILSKFIKIAAHCKSFNNMNSFLAIVIGLTNGAIGRLKQTWEKVPTRLRRRFEQFEALMDPSRNHRILRAYQSKLQPPVVPFMPLVVKDGFFLHEGNKTFVDDLVNFEKMQMVAAKVRTIVEYRQGALSNEIRTASNKNPNIQKYIREFTVIDCQKTLMKMSKEVEPSKPSS